MLGNFLENRSYNGLNIYKTDCVPMVLQLTYTTVLISLFKKSWTNLEADKALVDSNVTLMRLFSGRSISRFERKYHA